MSNHIDYLKETIAAEITAEETAMTAEEAESHICNLENWDLIEVNNGYAITRQFDLGSTDKAIEFANRLETTSNEMHNIPSVRIIEDRVEVICYTENLQGLHRNDFIMAANANDLYDHADVATNERDEVTEASDESFPASDAPAY